MCVCELGCVFLFVGGFCLIFNKTPILGQFFFFEIFIYLFFFYFFFSHFWDEIVIDLNYIAISVF